jgi:hypothetical protein
MKKFVYVNKSLEYKKGPLTSSKATLRTFLRFVAPELIHRFRSYRFHRYCLERLGRLQNADTIVVWLVAASSLVGAVCRHSTFGGTFSASFRGRRLGPHCRRKYSVSLYTFFQRSAFASHRRIRAPILNRAEYYIAESDLLLLSGGDSTG